MKRSLSAPSPGWLFALQHVAGLIGATGTLFVLFRLSTLAGRTWAIAVGVAITAVVIWRLISNERLRRSLKQVAVDDRFLYVTEYGGSTEAVIPLTEISDVTQWRGKSIRPVSVHLRSPSMFGTRIRFQPLQSGLTFQEDAVVTELRRLAHLSTLPTTPSKSRVVMS